MPSGWPLGEGFHRHRLVSSRVHMGWYCHSQAATLSEQRHLSCSVHLKNLLIKVGKKEKKVNTGSQFGISTTFKLMGFSDKKIVMQLKFCCSTVNTILLPNIIMHTRMVAAECLWTNAHSMHGCNLCSHLHSHSIILERKKNQFVNLQWSACETIYLQAPFGYEQSTIYPFSHIDDKSD